MRHGIAEDHSRSGHDADRLLTPEGREKTKKTGLALKRLGIGFSIILASPYARTRETAEIIASVLDLEKHLQACAALASGESHTAVIAEVAKAARKHDKVMLVGHEPTLSRLISIYISGELRASVQMKKGAIARLNFGHEPAPGEGTLEWLLAPKQLVALGSGE